MNDSRASGSSELSAEGHGVSCDSSRLSPWSSFSWMRNVSFSSKRPPGFHASKVNGDQANNKEQTGTYQVLVSAFQVMVFDFQFCHFIWASRYCILFRSALELNMNAFRSFSLLPWCFKCWFWLCNLAISRCNTSISFSLSHKTSLSSVTSLRLVLVEFWSGFRTLLK